MNKKIKFQKILTFSAVAVLALAGAGSALADSQVVNQNTGFDSENNAAALLTDDFSALNQNAQVIANAGNGALVSGGNLVLGNNGLGATATGDLDVSALFLNDTNVNELDHVGSWFFDPLVANQSTGANSLNNSSLFLGQAIGATNNNVADVTTGILIDGSSGCNTVEFNGGSGAIETGDILGDLKSDTAVNSNFLHLAGAAPDAGFLSQVGNFCTGAGSVNNSGLEVENSIGVQNTNVADIDNNIFALLSSGGNVIADNGGCGAACASLLTGDAIGRTTIKNAANANDTLVNANFGTLQVQAINDSTGFGSLNNAFAEVEQNVGVTNTNNADIDNNVQTAASTGGNLVFGNNGPAQMQTGDAGNIVAIQNGPINMNKTAVALGGAGAVIAANNSTGAGSVNNAAASLETNVGVVNTNNADIDNNVATTASSGGNVIENNSACGNCGGVSAIATGDAVNQTTIVNSVNSNQTQIAVAPLVVVEAVNSCTGADSVNNASSSATTNVAVVNTNNASITNNVTSVSSSGGNVVAGNTGGGAVSTGNAALVIGVGNEGNTNTTVIGQ